jgi:hypothetical protein
MESCWRADEEISQAASRPGHRRSLRRCRSTRRSRTPLRTPEGGRSRTGPITTANRVLGSPTSPTGIRLSNCPHRVSSPAPGRLSVRPLTSASMVSLPRWATTSTNPVSGSIFRSLSLKPPSECRYDHIALVPLDFRRPERHERKSSPKLSRHFCVEDVQKRVF